MLTNKAKYGLKAMLYLADHAADGGVRGVDIAQSESIPKKFLDAILITLRDHGLVRTKKGVKGGYQLAVAAERVTVGEIVRILDGPLAPIPCVSKTAYRPCPDCRSEADCRVRRLMAEVREALSDILDHTSLADMQRPATREQILDYVI
jgi:Rrf2 family protein